MTEEQNEQSPECGGIYCANCRYCVLCKGRRAYRLWPDGVSGFRGFKRNGRRDAAHLSAGRHVDPHAADSDLVSCTLYFQALPSALCPDDGLENMVLHFTGDQYHRNHTWLPDDRKAVDHSDVGRLADLFLSDSAWR